METINYKGTPDQKGSNVKILLNRDTAGKQGVTEHGGGGEG